MSASRITDGFVDAIEGEIARLLFGQQAVDLPVSLLPAGVTEGTWVRFSVSRANPPPDDGTEARRRRLGAGDPGGDIEL
jgi:hypothetical protein